RPSGAARVFVTGVGAAAAGPTRLRFMWFSANSSEKNATAMKKIPLMNSGDVTTALIAPPNPLLVRISSRSPIDFIAAAVSTSPVDDEITIVAIIAAAFQNDACIKAPDDMV